MSRHLGVHQDVSKQADDEEANENEKIEGTTASNQFHFIERATQTKINDVQDTLMQTDPPPM